MAYFRSVKEKHWLFIIFMLIFGNAAFYMLNLKHPYRKVELVEAYISKGYLYTTHTFIKGSCSRIRFTATGVSTDVSQFLSYEGLDGVPDDYDRDQGKQTLRLKVALGDLNPDQVIYRTRHDCDGNKTDKIFDTIETEDIQERDSRVSASILGLRGP